MGDQIGTRLASPSTGYRCPLYDGGTQHDQPEDDPTRSTNVTAPSYGYSGNLNTSYDRLNTLAQAYSQPGTGLTCDSGLRDNNLTGLDHPFRL
jgi:hypothetical protein